MSYGGQLSCHDSHDNGHGQLVEETVAMWVDVSSSCPLRLIRDQRYISIFTMQCDGTHPLSIAGQISRALSLYRNYCRLIVLAWAISSTLHNNIMHCMVTCRACHVIDIDMIT